MELVLILIIAVIFFVVIFVLLSNLQNRITILQLQIQALKKRLDQQEQSPLVGSTKALPNRMMEYTSPIIQQQPNSQGLINQNVAHMKSVVKVDENHNKTNSTVQPQSITTEQTAQNQLKKTVTATDKDSIGYRFMKWLIKGNPVAKVAMIILFFGLSYLLKYSIDHSLLSPEIRILGSLILGLALLTVGWKLRLKKALYALILQGGAIGVLYFTLFAGFKLYTLVPLPLTFALLIVVCATSIMFAILQRAISLAIIACIGGYLAPILLSTGSGNHVALFSYYLLISIAILIISFWQSWRILNLVGFLFTFVVAILWGYGNFKPEFYIECQLFILANLLIYGILTVLLSVRNDKKEPYQNLFDLILLFSVPLIAFSMQYLIVKNWQYAPGFSALAFGLFYLTGSFIALRIWHVKAKQLIWYGLAIGLAFSTLAVPLALTANWTTVVWLFEGTAITCAALSQKQYRFSWAGVIIILLSLFSIMVATICNHMEDAGFITLYATLSIVILFNACLWHHYRVAYSYAEPLKRLFIGIAIIAWSVWIIGSINRLFESSDVITPSIMLCYVVAVWLWFVIGRKIIWPRLCYAVIALWPILLIILINDIVFDSHIYTIGLWQISWLIAFASSYTYLYLDRKNLSDNSNKQLSLMLHISLLWIILTWLYYQLNWILSFLPWGFEVIKWSVLTLIAGFIILVFFLLDKYNHFPIQHYRTQYWKIGLLPLGVYLFVQLITGLGSSGQIIYWPYVPLINPLEEAAVFALMMLSLWFNLFIQSLQVSKQHNIRQIQPSLLRLLLISALVFLWSNSVILRSLSEWLDIPWSWYTLWHNNIVQVVLSLIWTLIAVILIAIAHRYLLRNVWLIGAILQAIVVFKLVLVDSVELAGLLRAFVFIGVALLMLVIGYLAPLPPKIILADQKELKDK
ncbi:DUF2339 domain-containing protein [Orbus sturtevantii]|uniref:DUF2339 domain-containing protein n=1 Tax=Orbus sturtevantii TaxID=3074109 RepID=UPI00370D4A7E